MNGLWFLLLGSILGMAGRMRAPGEPQLAVLLAIAAAVLGLLAAGFLAGFLPAGLCVLTEKPVRLTPVAGWAAPLSGPMMYADHPVG